jgi:hypothetical protein
VQSARHLVGAAVELSAGVELRQHHLGRGNLLDGMLVHRNAAAVVHDGDRVVDVDRDLDRVAVAALGLVDRVVDDLVDEVVQARLPGGPDVHRGPLANGLEALEDLDFAGVVVGAAGQVFGIDCVRADCGRDCLLGFVAHAPSSCIPPVPSVAPSGSTAAPATTLCARELLTMTWFE